MFLYNCEEKDFKMTQVQSIYKKEDTNIQQQEKNRFETCEEIVLELIENGIPNDFNPDNFIQDVAKKYGITKSESRSCIKMAIKNLESGTNDNSLSKKFEDSNNYFWASGYANATSFKQKNDGMDSLVSFANYNRLVFGIK